MIRILLLTGVSGAGKSTACHAFEERGYRLVENVPTKALPALVSAFYEEEGIYRKTVLIFPPEQASEAVSYLKKQEGIDLTVTVLDCALETLLSRYRLTRHVHPLQAQGFTLEEALEKDHEYMEELRPLADLYLDTTGMDPKDLRGLILSQAEGEADHLIVHISSFAYKHGVPRDAEVVLDCRSVPNPYWVEELRPLTGLDQPIIDFLESKKEVGEMLEAMETYLRQFLKNVSIEKRRYVSINLGCSGGQHRSVYFAQKLSERLGGDYRCVLTHRELWRHQKP